MKLWQLYLLLRDARVSPHDIVQVGNDDPELLQLMPEAPSLTEMVLTPVRHVARDMRGNLVLVINVEDKPAWRDPTTDPLPVATVERLAPCLHDLDMNAEVVVGIMNYEDDGRGVGTGLGIREFGRAPGKVILLMDVPRKNNASEN
jgi:hypothetical protein